MFGRNVKHVRIIFLYMFGRIALEKMELYDDTTTLCTVSYVSTSKYCPATGQTYSTPDYTARFCTHVLYCTVQVRTSTKYRVLLSPTIESQHQPYVSQAAATITCSNASRQRRDNNNDNNKEYVETHLCNQCETTNSNTKRERERVI